MPADWLEAVFHLRRTGSLLDVRTGHPVPNEVVTVMTATLMGSVETLVEALGGQTPRTVLFEVDRRRIVIAKVDSQSLVVLIAPDGVSGSDLRREAQRIVALLGPRARPAPPGRAEVRSRP